MTELCVSITEVDGRDAVDAIHALPPEVGLCEVRLDCLQGDFSAIQSSVDCICRSSSRPIIATNRPKSEGGHWQYGESQRIELLLRAASLGAQYIDVELTSCDRFPFSAIQSQIIVSHHDFENTPPLGELNGIYDACLEKGADIVKIACMANDAADSARMLEFLRLHAKKDTGVIALCMGEEGIPTRVLAPKFGAFLSFASQSNEMQSAEGQLTWDQMLNLYHFNQINEYTDVYGVAANPVSHSMSPAIHNAAFSETKLNAVYLPFKVHNPASFINTFVPLGLNGLSVTIPHKEAMLPLMDELDHLTRKVGALNTVNIVDGKLFGFNTDVSAALSVLRSAVEKGAKKNLESSSVLIVGAGGAGKALAYGLAGSVGKLMIANRTLERAEKLAAATGASACAMDSLTEYTPDIIINTTSVGMHPNTEAMPVPEIMLQKQPLVFDAIYNPLETKLLRKSKDAGCITASGFAWFANQAVKQFEIWTKKKAPRKVMARVVKKRLSAF